VRSCARKKKYHKSAPNPTGRNGYKRTRSGHRPVDQRLLIDSNLSPSEIPTAKALVLEQICEHGSPTVACIHAGVGRRTFYQWLHENDGAFRKAYGEARRIWRASAIADIESAFSVKAQFKDTLAGIFLLKHNTKRYREVSRVQLSGPDGGPIMTLDAKEELIRRIEKIAERMESKPIIAAGGSEVRELPAGSQGLSVVKSEPSGPRVRKARGVRYG
jgi:hypothetical protein